MKLTLEELKAHLDGELSPARHEEVERALAEDAGLRREAARLEAIGRAVASEATIPVTGQERTLAELARRQKRRGARWGISPWVWAAGTACVVGLAFLSVPPQEKAEFRMQTAVFRPEMKGESVGAAAAPAAPEAQSTTVQDQAGEATEMPMRAPAAPGAGQAETARSAPPVGGVDIARTAQVSLRVDDASQAKAALETEARRVGGFVASSTFDRSSETPTAHVAVRVPAARLDAVVAFAKGLGGLSHEDSTAEDVTAERVDQEARLANMRQEEASLRGVLARAKKVSEILEVRQQLSEVRGNIESLSAQLKELRGRVALSSLDATLEQRPKVAASASLEEGWPQDSAQGALASLRSFGRRLGTALIYVAVFAVPVVPIVVVAWMMRRRR